MGIVLDGIPESAVIGIGMMEKGVVSGAILMMLANSMIPESFEYCGKLAGIIIGTNMSSEDPED